MVSKPHAPCVCDCVRVWVVHVSPDGVNLGLDGPEVSQVEGVLLDPLHRAFDPAPPRLEHLSVSECSCFDRNPAHE